MFVVRIKFGVTGQESPPEAATIHCAKCWHSFMTRMRIQNGESYADYINQLQNEMINYISKPIATVIKGRL